MATNTHLVIAAIDFGTTYSGYAYGFRHDLQNTNNKITAPVHTHKWINELANTATEKTPTSILFTPDGQFHSFGYEAEKKYADLADKDEHVGWKYFKHFKMKLHDTAGLSSKQTSLAHEPEAAAIYCRFFDVNLNSDTEGNITLSSLEEGSQFMVLDLGGGTVDITTCEVQSDDTLKELCPRGGGPWGGNIVNEALNCKLFNDVFGETFMTEFAKENKYDYLALTELIELKKRLTGMTSSIASDPIRINLPNEFLSFYKMKVGEKMMEKLSKVDQRPYVKKGKIFFDASSFEEAFTKSIEMLITEVKTLISKYELTNVKTFMMVGGFSNSPIMQKAVKVAFPDKVHVIPEDTSTVVMKGAVMYGFRKTSIRSRKLPYTYGICTSEDYDPLKHPANIFYDKVDVFCPFVRKGTEVSSDGIVVEKTFGKLLGLGVDIYQTPADDLGDMVLMNDESFKFERIGTIDVKTSASKSTNVRMVFGVFDVEVAIRARDTEKWITATFDAL